MRRLALVAAGLAGLLAGGPAVQASEAGACARAGGVLVVGTVVRDPWFARGRARRGVELSHTHLRLRDDQGVYYDIAADNVFAAGYDAAGDSVPAPLAGIRRGDRVEACGKPYASGGPGLDWVHTNCGDVPTSERPDGWLKRVDAGGSLGPNLEASPEYCGLWSRRFR